MSIKNKGFVLLETIIVMCVLLIGMILLYSNYNKIFMNSGKISYYDNVEDMYTAYYVYLNKDTMNTNSNGVVDVSDNEVLKNLGIERIYFIDKDVFTNLYTKEVSSCENLDSLNCFDGSTIAYLKSIENKSDVDKCAENNNCLTIVKIKRGNHYYFAKFEAYNIKQDAINGDVPEYPTPDPITPDPITPDVPDVPEITQKIYNYSYNGNYQTFTAPIAGNYKLETWGAQGGTATNGTSTYIGGYGGYSVGTISLKAGESIYVNVGGAGIGGNSYNTVTTLAGGYNGGGKTSSTSGVANDHIHTSGGGATHIAFTSGLLKDLNNNLNNIIIVSGGGGGAFLHKGGNDYSGNGGSAGGYIGSSAVKSVGNGSQGLGGSQTEGGKCSSSENAANCKKDTSTIFGSFGLGGIAPKSWGSSGGAGLYGGGASNGDIKVLGDSGGGGGSSYIGNPLLTNKVMYCYNCTESSAETTKTISTTCHSSTPTENCAKEGNGYAKITYIGKTTNLG